MEKREEIVRLSAIDQERFGVRTARATDVTRKTLPLILEFCRKEEVSLLIARCDVGELDAARDMEGKGFLLMDTQIYYVRDLAKESLSFDPAQLKIRPVLQRETTSVMEIASESFKGYMGHYHADRRLDSAKCDEAYVSWAMRSCLSREVAHEVLVAEREGDLVGFATLRINSPSEGEGVLFAVSPRAQKAGVYGCLIAAGIDWCRKKGVSSMLVSTQITNFAVQKVWIRQGFEPFKALYTLHKWFD
jgi:GNAT superfamily N-acetyltransferase